MKTPQPILIDETAPHFDTMQLVHRVWEPDGEGPHPTIVMNHGRYGNEDVMWIFSRSLPKEWLLVAPRAALTDPGGGNSWELHSEKRWAHKDDFAESITKFDAFVAQLATRYNADLDNLYLMGFSQGTALNAVYTMGGFRPIKGIVNLVGFMPDGLEPAPNNPLTDMPILHLVGRKDQTIPLEISRQGGQRLIECGARLDYREYETGHKLNSRGIKDLAAWWSDIAHNK